MGQGGSQEKKVTSLIGKMDGGEKGALDKLWAQIDLNVDGILQRDEAVEFFGILFDYISKRNRKGKAKVIDLPRSRYEAIMGWFKSFDVDGNGELTKRELHVGLQKLGIKVPFVPTAQTLKTSPEKPQPLSTTSPSSVPEPPPPQEPNLRTSITMVRNPRRT